MHARALEGGGGVRSRRHGAPKQLYRFLEAIGQLRHLDTMENLGFDEPDYFPSDDDEAGREGRVEMASALAEMGVPPDDRIAIVGAVATHRPFADAAVADAPYPTAPVPTCTIELPKRAPETRSAWVSAWHPTVLETTPEALETALEDLVMHFKQEVCFHRPLPTALSKALYLHSPLQSPLQSPLDS